MMLSAAAQRGDRPASQNVAAVTVVFQLVNGCSCALWPDSSELWYPDSFRDVDAPHTAELGDEWENQSSEVAAPKIKLCRNLMSCGTGLPLWHSNGTDAGAMPLTSKVVPRQTKAAA